MFLDWSELACFCSSVFLIIHFVLFRNDPSMIGVIFRFVSKQVLYFGFCWSARWFDGVYTCLVSTRQVAKLGEIKLKRIQQLNTADSSLVVRKHKEVLNLMMRTLQLDTYGLTWVQFSKGVGVGSLLVWLLMRWKIFFAPCSGRSIRYIGLRLQGAGMSDRWWSITVSLSTVDHQFVFDRCRLSKKFAPCVSWRSLMTSRCIGRNLGSEKLGSLTKHRTSFGRLLWSLLQKLGCTGDRIGDD